MEPNQNQNPLARFVRYRFNTRNRFIYFIVLILPFLAFSFGRLYLLFAKIDISDSTYLRFMSMPFDCIKFFANDPTCSQNYTYIGIVLWMTVLVASVFCYYYFVSEAFINSSAEFDSIFEIAVNLKLLTNYDDPIDTPERLETFQEMILQGLHV